MIELTDIDKRLLEEIQHDFPLTDRPYKEIGKCIGISENEIISRIHDLKKKNIIRDISAIFNAGSLGYKSTLVAVRSNDPSATAVKINRHPGVSHNYLREHLFNLWFTLTIREEYDFKTEVEKFFGMEVRSYHILPSIKTFKVGVHFTFLGKKISTVNNIVNQPGRTVIDEKIIILLQEQFPLVTHPWKKLADRAQMSEADFIIVIKQMKNSGAIKRISAVLRHRNAGFIANGMACFKVPAGKVTEAGRTAAGFPEVSHCYQRPVFPDWQYNIFAMIHGRSTEQCEAIIAEIAEKINVEDHFTLYSINEFKKERVRYFMEDTYV